MTISTSSSTRQSTPSFRVAAAVVLAVSLAAAVLLAWKTSPADSGRSVAREAKSHHAVVVEAAAAEIVKTLGKSGKELLSALYIDFDLATRGAEPGKSRMTALPQDNAAGITCSPAVLSRHTANLRMILPASFAARKSALAVLTPDGNLRIVYIPYGPDTESVELVIPSRSIDWEQARSRRDFVVDVERFEALRPDKNIPEPLFRQVGIYQFALIKGIDRDLLEVIGRPFQIIAGCVVRYQP